MTLSSNNNELTSKSGHDNWVNRKRERKKERERERERWAAELIVEFLMPDGWNWTEKKTAAAAAAAAADAAAFASASAV